MFFFFFLKDNVEEFLKESLYSSESYEKDKVFGDYIVDFYLPQGSRRLNYPEKTVIMVKDDLSSGTTFHARKRAGQLSSKFGINRYCLMSRNIPYEVVPLKSSHDESIFRLIDFDSLQNSINRHGVAIFEDDVQWNKKREQLLAKARQVFSFGRISLFLGAGVSQDAGLSGWSNLLEDIVRQLHVLKEISVNESRAIQDDSADSLIIQARYLKHICSERDVSLVDLLRHSLYDSEIHESHLINSIVKAIKMGKVSEIITYNYDDLLEKNLDKNEVSYSVLDKSSRPEPGSLPIFHVHGFLPEEKDASFDKNVVLSEDEYHSLYKDSFHWSNIEQLHALVQTTCFFIGLSMKDPSLRRLLDIANERGSKNPVHYAFLRRGDYKEPIKAEEIYYNMGVNIIWFENFHELPSLIERMCCN